MELLPYAYTLVVLFGAITILAIIKEAFHWVMMRREIRKVSMKWDTHRLRSGR